MAALVDLLHLVRARALRDQLAGRWRGGLDSKLRIPWFDFSVSTGACQVQTSKDEVWGLLQQIDIYPDRSL